MWTVFFAGLLTLQAITANGFDFCGIEKCTEGVSSEIMDRPEFFPTVEYLESVCSPLLEVAGCIIGKIEECTKKTYVELAQLDSPISAMLNPVWSIKQLYTELCDLNSSFRKDYIQAIPCIKRFMETLGSEDCAEKARGAYDIYLKYVEDNPLAQKLQGEPQRCIFDTYLNGCSGVHLKDQCGQSSFDVVIKIFKHMRILHPSVCFPGNIPALKTTFLDALQLEAENRVVFSKFIDATMNK